MGGALCRGTLMRDAFEELISPFGFLYEYGGQRFKHCMEFSGNTTHDCLHASRDGALVYDEMRLGKIIYSQSQFAV